MFGRTIKIPPKKGCPNSANKAAEVTTPPPTKKYSKYLIINKHKNVGV